MMKINPKLAKDPSDLNQLSFQKMRGFIKKEFLRLEKNTSPEELTQFIYIAENAAYVDKMGQPLPLLLLGTWKGKFKNFAKKEVIRRKEKDSVMGFACYGGVDPENGLKLVRLKMWKGKAKKREALLKKSIKKLVPKATHKIIFEMLSDEDANKIQHTVVKQSVLENYDHNDPQSVRAKVSLGQLLKAISITKKTVPFSDLRKQKADQEDLQNLERLYTQSNDWLDLFDTESDDIQSKYSEAHSSVTKLRDTADVLLTTFQPQQSGTSPTEDTSENKTAINAADQAAAIGAQMIKEVKYKAGYAYIPFTGKATGKKYKRGDKIAQQDIEANYGGNRPTWCNQFAMDMTKSILGDNTPFDYLPEGQGFTNANELYEFMHKAEGVLFDSLGSFEQAWQEINAGKLVYFVSQAKIGHIATGIPTENLRFDRKTQQHMIGKIVQAGSKTTICWIDEVWGNLDKVKIFKSKIDQPLAEGEEQDPNLFLKIYNSITKSVGYKGKNTREDVKVVQQLLVNDGNNIGATGPFQNGVDCACGGKTIGAIQDVQARIGQETTGVIEMNDPTWEYLWRKSKPLVDAAQLPDQKAEEDEPQDESQDEPQEDKESDKLTPEKVTFKYSDGHVNKLNPHTEEVLRELLAKANEPNVVITSTFRSTSEQAEIMYNNIVQYGPDFNRKFYGKNAGLVVDAFEEARRGGKNPVQIRKILEQTIHNVGPSSVSQHCNPNNPAVDIHPNSIKNSSFFEVILSSDPRVEFIAPPKDPFYHLEID
ncbi:MAG: hypothetical protein MK212_10635 [Saprospiraceae bacterium]|nr:hypothetical protein [Saprospiraceae bacterium]